MSRDKDRRDPQERVDQMNGIFDRLVLPMIIFTAVMFLVFGVIPKLGSCGENTGADAAQPEPTEAFYDLRDRVLADVGKYTDSFEAAGFTLLDSDGTQIVYKKLESGMEIIDDLRDSHGYTYTLLCLTDDASGAEISVMLYTQTVSLVIVTNGGVNTSAVFSSEEFYPDTSASDSDQAQVLALVGRERLAGMVGQYKTELMAAVG